MKELKKVDAFFGVDRSHYLLWYPGIHGDRRMESSRLYLHDNHNHYHSWLSRNPGTIFQRNHIHEGSKLVGLTLEECGIGRDLGVIIVAVKQPTGETKFNPSFRSTIKAGDTLIALGEVSKLKDVEEMSKPPRPR